MMIGMMIIAPELDEGGFSGICGGVAMTSGVFPGAVGTLRAGRGTGLVATGISFGPPTGAGVWVATLGMISRSPRIA
ncbi:hypothetical protein A9R04_01330 [Nocardiopsis dassonvillei]|nr:hypothetical protein A9R04_01330 [Nocardiopsis dassonvillei]